VGLFKNPFKAKPPKRRWPESPRQELFAGDRPAAPLPVNLTPRTMSGGLNGVPPRRRGHWPKGKLRPESHKIATREGMERARAAGKHIGRPRKGF
jgi:hypothetical protein